MTAPRPRRLALRTLTLSAAACAAAIAACDAASPPVTQPEEAGVAMREQILDVADAWPKATIRINGERFDPSDRSALERIDPAQIRSVEIVKSVVQGVPGAEAGRSSRSSDRSRAAARPEPLFVVDGVRVADLDQLGPNDIARIEVIKGPAAAALYGEEAEAGVVWVTTK